MGGYLEGDNNTMKKILNVETPYYLIDENKLTMNFITLKNEFEKQWTNIIISYSFKTNSIPWLLNWMKENDAYAEVVSQKEYKLALEVGYKPEKIVFNGPYKGFDMLEYALNNNSIVNLDSFSEIEWIKNHKPNNNDNTWEVGLRINFDLEGCCPGETIMGCDVGRFGFNIENGSIERAICELQNLDYVKIVGLHGHHSTKTKSLNVFKAISEKLCEMSKAVKNTLKYVDLGGCFFGDKPNTPTFSEYAATICYVLEKYFDCSETKLIIEPGAAIIASPISFVCKVVDIKDVQNKRIVTTDGSCLNIDPQMHGIKFEVDNYSSSENIIDEQIVAGYTCIEKDRLTILKNECELNIGDDLVFKNTGAYSMALSPLFIQYYPAIIVNSNEKFYYARKPWDVKEYMSKSCIGYSNPIEE